MEVLALIPARSGSKSIIDKNIRMIAGKPMLVHSVEHALASKLVTRVILSTDSEEYARIGREAGAEVPFLRPAEFAADDSLDIDVFEHALKWLKENEGYEPDVLVHLRPTFPTRDPADIDKMVELLLDHPEADCVRSMAEAKDTPFKMWFIDKGNPEDGDFDMKTQTDDQADSKKTGEMGVIKPVVSIPGLEACSMPRQALPKAYLQNACIDVIRTETITRKRSMTGDTVLGYLMEDDCDIDYEEDFKKAEQKMIK
ncbi:MAG: acylneuraminate cytidylyltransferase family protein [Lachnospiraceae bacterium]|nr:acylneuraminate cytidylyltransferase family protein [Lachnospiraceae bacterium]